jgi:hypothetical protein
LIENLRGWGVPSHPDPDARVERDQLKAILVGGIVATVLAYYAIRIAYPCLAPPLGLIDHDPLGLGNILGYEVLPLLAVAMGLYLVLLSSAYAADVHPKLEKHANTLKKGADILFFVCVALMIVAGFVLVARYAEFIEQGGLNPTSVAENVKACKAALGNSTSFGS